LLGRDRTRGWFVDALGAAQKRLNFEIWAYVVMPEHAHVLILPTEPSHDLSKILSAIKLPVARRAMQWLRDNSPGFLDRLRVERPNGRVEHQFWLQGGGYDRNIIRTDTAWTSVQYLHDNPVRRGLVEKAVDWPWSSARQYAGCDDVVLRVDDCPN
jgi:putative transposase